MLSPWILSLELESLSNTYRSTQSTLYSLSTFPESCLESSMTTSR